MQLTVEAPENLADLGRSYAERYENADPFPHIVLDGVFRPEALDAVLDEFPDDLMARKGAQTFDNDNELKAASRGEFMFGEQTKALARFCNSEPFLAFLENMTGVENLIPDAHFRGGGLHQIPSGGFLKVHADFNRHEDNGLDRRLNALIYLNKDWPESWGGHLELWDKPMEKPVVRAAPLFNRLVVFSTTSTSWHGHPDPVACPQDRTRRSFALYYYTNGRPDEERPVGTHNTLFQARPDSEDVVLTPSLRHMVKQRVKKLLRPVLNR